MNNPQSADNDISSDHSSSSSSNNNQTADTQANPMSFIEHLSELRKRLIRMLVTIIVCFIPLMFFSQEIYTFVATPVFNVLPQNASMIATEVTSTFFAPFKLTFFVALALSAPMILHQIWAFISPGLYLHERQVAIPLLLSSVVLFYLGIAFAYYVVFPILLTFFAAASPEGVAFMPDIQEYLNVALKLFLAFGAAFEIPVALMLLIWSGVVTAQDIKSKRPYIIVICFVIAMLMTPPDIFSQTLLAVPMWMLFELGLFMSRWIQPKSARL